MAKSLGPGEEDGIFQVEMNMEVILQFFQAYKECAVGIAGLIRWNKIIGQGAEFA